MTEVTQQTALSRRIDGVFLGALLLLFASVIVALHPHVRSDDLKWFIVRCGAPGLAALFYGARILAETPPRFPSLFLAALLLPIAQLVSLIGATNVWLGLTALSQTAALVCVLFVTVNVVHRSRGAVAVLWTIWGCGVAVAAYGVAQHYGYDFFNWGERHDVPVTRGVSFFGHSTFAASFLILSILLSCGLFSYCTGVVLRTGLFAGIALMGFHLSFTGARGAAIAILAGGGAFAVLAAYDAWKAGNLRSTTGRLSLACFVLAFTVAGSALLYRAWSVKESDVLAFKQSAGSARIALWETAARLFYRNPVTGVGAGNFEIASPAYWNEYNQELYTRANIIGFEVHNEYLEIASEQGIIGIGAFSAFLFLTLYTAFTNARLGPGRERWLDIALFGALIAACVDALLIFNLQAPGTAATFWLVVGLIAARGTIGRPARDSGRLV